MFRTLARFLSRWWSAPRPAPTVKKRRRTQLQLEALENRWVPSTIAGYVYNDANNNGIMDGSEQGIAGQTVELYSANSTTPIATTTTDANGYYQFASNPNAPTGPQSSTQTLSFTNPVTGESLDDTIDQFDPSLGTLNSVDITVNGQLTSDIKITNTDGASGQVSGTVSGDIAVSGLPDTTNPLTTTLTGTPQKSTIASNGSVDFGDQTVTGSQTVDLEASQQNLSAWIGTGTMNVTEQADSTSTASGPGNIVDNITSSGSATVQVTYNYTPNTALPPGNYKVVELQTPPGYLDGLLTNNNITPIPNSVGQHEIDVTLTNNNSLENNFGAVKPASVSGYVYYDANDNGVMDPSESGIAGSTIQLTGTNDLGKTIDLTATTAANGSYQFGSLRPGTYTLTDLTQPTGYLQGTDDIGSQGGTVGQDVLSQITLNPATNGLNNDFGWVKTGTLSGTVYSDLNNTGVLQQNDPGIGGVSIELTGTTATGQTVDQTAQTASDGTYSFSNLVPGTYALTKLNTPTGYTDGATTIGTQGGNASPDHLTALTVTGTTNGINNNFGEVQQGQLSGFAYDDSNNDGVKETSESGVPGVTIQLTGTTSTGQSVSKTQTTAADGSYAFTGLQPGTYTLTKESTPTGYIDGKDTIGSQGGVVGTDTFTQIVLTPAQSGINNNFGMYQAGSLSGYTYIDAKGTGSIQPGDPALPRVDIILAGTNIDGVTVNQSVLTNSAGFYQFTGLLPGSYTITQVPAVGYLPGQQTIGSLGGTDTQNEFFVSLGAEQNGQNYNFGYLTPPPVIPNVPVPVPVPVPDPSKYWLIT